MAERAEVESPMVEICSDPTKDCFDVIHQGRPIADRRWLLDFLQARFPLFVSSPQCSAFPGTSSVALGTGCPDSFSAQIEAVREWREELASNRWAQDGGGDPETARVVPGWAEPRGGESRNEKRNGERVATRGSRPVGGVSSQETSELSPGKQAVSCPSRF